MREVKSGEFAPSTENAASVPPARSAVLSETNLRHRFAAKKQYFIFRGLWGGFKDDSGFARRRDLSGVQERAEHVAEFSRRGDHRQMASAFERVELRIRQGFRQLPTGGKRRVSVSGAMHQQYRYSNAGKQCNDLILFAHRRLTGQ
ncbi:MAG: hypothetical protein R3F54_17855 [Alphaproteobacteria bacterium]